MLYSRFLLVIYFIYSNVYTLIPISYFITLLHPTAAAKSLQSCLTLCDPIDGSPPGSPVPGILQERTLEWVAISFSNAWKWKVKVKSLSSVLLLATPWIAAHQAPLSMGFSRQKYWSGVPLTAHNSFAENKDHGIWSHHFMGNRWGNSGNSVKTLFLGAPKSLQMVTAAMKFKDAYSLEGKLWPT